MDNNNSIFCCCGKKCKNKGGLKLHQRSCKVHQNLKSSNNSNESNSEADPPPPPPQVQRQSNQLQPSHSLPPSPSASALNHYLHSSNAPVEDNNRASSPSSSTQVQQPFQQPSHGPQSASSAPNINFIACCCGKYCKGRKGLIMHHRSCKLHKTLILSNTSKVTESSISPHVQQPVSSSPSNVEKTEIPLPGVKLPRTPAQWSEANAYFQLHQKSLPAYYNIDEFTLAFQTMIYNYFAANYGTIKSQTSLNDNKNKSIKTLKKELKQLKSLGHNNHRFDVQISSISKTLRSKLSSRKLATTKTPDTTNQLKRRFWWFCKRLFTQSKSQGPLFSVDDCKNYFSSALSDDNSKKYQLPNWVPSTSKPTTPCNTSPPSYHEISSIVYKCKAKSSPCPLDQISIIPFKRCPILRTILQQLIAQYSFNDVLIETVIKLLYGIYCDRSNL
ncbi:hypothetical protein HELRODRAFT_174249 [Helobdella robusta]|uniref:Uncharacterized protein n=1 Tax=Helobdella robusta TaxID=6412 RepID=T1F7V8_HELRO|nr:hypothetical protein HELRODRAFT_174249 [Helobdella robusta]ESO02825.1 hypothetical protein HELRODRAFT_174249 [Helobdella robusta]